jgi:phage N-6-adenine-methyltransferase
MAVDLRKQRGPKPSDLQWTPKELFDRLDSEFGFTLDVAAEDDPDFHRCETYFTPRDDGLNQSWATEGAVWCNPPYSDIKPWVRKARAEAETHGGTIVLLTMATTSAKWFRFAMKHATEVRFIIGNVTFGPNLNRAPFGSSLVIFRQQQQATPGHAFVTWMNRDVKNRFCHLCPAKFAKDRKLTGHLRSAHNLRKRPQGLICADCDNTFHVGFVCDECPEFAQCSSCSHTCEAHVHPIRKY